LKLAQVVFACVANDEHHDRILVQFARNTESSDEVCSRRAATKYPFHTAQLARSLKRLAIGHVNDIVHIFDVNIWRNYFLTDSFNQIRSSLHQFSCFLVSLKYRSIRVGANDLYGGVLLFQKAACAGDGSTRSQSGNEVRDLSLSLLPDLWSRSAIVSFRICW